MNSTKTYFGDQLLSECVLSFFVLLSSQSNYLQTLRLIYTGKSSAFTGHRSARKPSQAEMHGMREVFPEAVAYAAVQVSAQYPTLFRRRAQKTSQAYYGLSSLDSWDTEDRFFKLDIFFDKCVRLFTEDPNDPWVTDTLNFLTRYLRLTLFSSLLILFRQMPALTRRGKRPLPTDLEEEEGDLGNIELVGILAQRAARREAAQEQEAAQAQEAAQGQAGNQVRRFQCSFISLLRYLLLGLPRG
jgi:hypothetical protein